MLCPKCNKGDVKVIVHIVYEWDTAPNGTIIETKRLASLLDAGVEDVALCNTCGQKFDIDYEHDKVLPAYQDNWIKECR